MSWLNGKIEAPATGISPDTSAPLDEVETGTKIDSILEPVLVPNFFETVDWEFTFQDVLKFIDTYFDFTYSPFSIWELKNTDPWKTTGSCKVLAYAKFAGLSWRGVLDLFWEHYQSVKSNPDWSDHPNIRALIKHGIDMVNFGWDFPLTPKKS